MRIPSQFNQDSLYRRDNRHRETGDSYRRLLRLVIGLALVIVVMKQASQPGLYQVFFDPSVSSTQIADRGGAANRPPQGAAGLALAAAEPATGSTTATVVSPEDQRVANQLVGDLRASDQRLWLVALSRWRTGRPVASIPSSLESVAMQLSMLETIDAERRDAWERMLDAFTRSVRSAPASDQPERDQQPADVADAAGLPAAELPSAVSQPAPEDLPRVVAMITALENAAAARVVDGSVWRAGDFDSLYRFLDQASVAPPQNVAAVGVIPLLQQPDVYRGQWVSVHGAVARNERIDAQANPYGISHYWQIWLRPLGGTDRPIVAIVPRVPESVAAVGAEATQLEGPEIVVVGRFLKRLAYQSGIGADLAPVVVGQITSAPISEREMESMADAGEEENLDAAWWPIVLACALGLASAFLVMWRTAVSARRARELRTSHRAEPGSFLQKLEDSIDRSDRPAPKDDSTEDR